MNEIVPRCPRCREPRSSAGWLHHQCPGPIRKPSVETLRYLARQESWEFLVTNLMWAADRIEALEAALATAAGQTQAGHAAAAVREGME